MRQAAAYGQAQSGQRLLQSVEYRRGLRKMAETVSGNVDEQSHDAGLPVI